MNWIVSGLLSLLAHAPAIAADVAEAVNQHWGKDHVEQARKGLDVLNKVFADAAPVVSDALNAAKGPTS